MKRLALVTALLLTLATAITAGGSAAGATRTEFTGGIGLMNPCNGEIVSGTGPVKIVYQESADLAHFVVHLTFDVKADGDQGNTYVMSFVANDQFDAPTGTGAGFSFFDLPLHGEVVTKGPAPNFANVVSEAGMRVFVAGGVPTGALFISPATTTCHG